LALTSEKPRFDDRILARALIGVIPAIATALANQANRNVFLPFHMHEFIITPVTLGNRQS
jgi:hypothetical protein